jgi:DNA-binding transcriptional LysR family regulator
MTAVDFNFEKLQILMLLYEMQSFSGVARALNTSQSVISRTIQDLEKSLGKKLIQNNQKPITLTEDGLALFAIIKNAKNEMQNIEENLVFQKPGFKDSKIRLYISIAMTLSCIISEKVKTLLKRFPELFIDISFSKEITMDLMNKKDLIITKNLYEDTLIDNHFIKKYKMVFGASREYLKKRGHLKYASSLQYHDFIYVEDYYYRDFVPISILPFLKKKFVILNELCALKSIEQGCGIGIVPDFTPEFFPNIVTFELEEKLLDLNIYTAATKVKRNAYTEMILDFLNKEL